MSTSPARIIGGLLAAALMRDLNGSWDRARDLYVWEREGLDWLVEHGNGQSGNDWTRMILTNGYPAKPFVDHNGQQRPAGFYWSPTTRDARRS